MMNLLFTLDGRYLPQLEVALTSIWMNNPGAHFHIFIMHRSLDETALAYLEKEISAHGDRLTPLLVDDALFSEARATSQYPQEMYYRMLAGALLPAEVERVIYLDPDILVINSLRPLWETDLAGNIFAAAAHSGKTEIVSSVNRVRLGTESDYFNSGVLLIDLVRAREEIVPEEIFRYAQEHAQTLILPDQDMLNALFGVRILPLSDVVWNYDARDYRGYYLTSGRKCDLDWVLDHTVVLHFCGKQKPWKKGYHYRFGVLYKHYARLSRRLWQKEAAEN